MVQEIDANVQSESVNAEAETGAEIATPTAADIVKSDKRLDDDTLANLQSLDDVRTLLGGDVVDISDYGNGFTVLEGDERDRLIGVPFVIVDWQENVGDYGPFSTLMVMTEGNDKYIINDGSTGIHQEMQAFSKRAGGRVRGFVVPKGLTRSDYTFVDGEGKHIPATTYHINTAKARQTTAK